MYASSLLTLLVCTFLSVAVDSTRGTDRQGQPLGIGDAIGAPGGRPSTVAQIYTAPVHLRNRFQAQVQDERGRQYFVDHHGQVIDNDELSRQMTSDANRQTVEIRNILARAKTMGRASSSRSSTNGHEGYSNS